MILVRWQYLEAYQNDRSSTTAFCRELPVDESPAHLGLLELVNNKVVSLVGASDAKSVRTFGICGRLRLCKALRGVGVLIKNLGEPPAKVGAAFNAGYTNGDSHRKSRERSHGFFISGDYCVLELFPES